MTHPTEPTPTKTEVRYTNAPVVYDYETTVIETTDTPMHIKMGMNRDVPFRRVVLDAREDRYYAVYQCQRYQSGSYLVLDEQEWAAWQADGTIVPIGESSDASV